MCANYFLVKNGNKVIKNYNFKKHIGSYWFSQGFYFLLWPNLFLYCFFISVQFSCWVMFISLWPHGLQYARLICPSPTPKACPNSCLSSWWRHPTISFSAVPFSSRLQSFPASGSFPMSQFFASSGQSIGASASASVLPMNIQDRFPLGLTGLISLQSKGLSRVLFNTTVQKHQSSVLSFLYGWTFTSIHNYWEKQSFD